ncbi:MAG: hypothetical protein Q7R71_01010 [bacterium]|nr:hypothetical protein [bacterium]
MDIVKILETAEKRRDRWRDEALKKWKKLFSLQKWWLRHGGRIYVRHEQLVPGNDYNDPETALYMFYCPEHDIADIDYLHGSNGRLDCSLCRQVNIERWPLRPVPPISPLAA